MDASLGRRTLFGVLWQGLQVLCNRGLNLLGQIVLARYFLSPGERGQVTLAISVLAVFGVMGDFGVGRFLVRRNKRLGAWEGVGARVMLGSGLVSAALMAVFAPLALRLWPDNAGLHWMILALTLDLPLRALMVPMRARLQTELRFRALSVIQMVQGVVMVGGSIGLALAGFGPWSMISPIPAASFVGVVLMAFTTGWPLAGRSRPGQWRLMLPDLMSVAGYALCLQIIYNGDNLVVGRIAGKAELGLYAMAYTLAVQAVNLISGSLSTVLFPAFATLRQQPQRLQAAFGTSVRMLAFVAIPLCLLQIPLAEPVVRVLYQKQQWLDCIPMLQLLSVGVAFRAVGLLADPLLMAAGSTRRLLALGAVQACLVVLGALLGCCLGPGGALGAAGGVAVAYALGYTLAIGLAMRALALPVRPVFAALWPAVVSALFACGTAAMAGHFIPWGVGTGGQTLKALAMLTAAGGVYLGLMRVLAPQVLREMFTRLRGRQ